jgi:hypothetical protein
MFLQVYHLRRMLPERWRARFHFITRRVPKHWWYLSNDRRFWWITGVADEMLDRAGLVTYDLADGCFAETYRVDHIGIDGQLERGVAAFVVVHGSEVLKFDCLGSNGHYHVATPFPHGIRKGLQGRIWLKEKTIEEQVERVVFELSQNLDYYLQTHPRRKVRNTHIDPQRLAAVCAEMKRRMLDDLAGLYRVPPASALQGAPP